MAASVCAGVRARPRFLRESPACVKARLACLDASATRQRVRSNVNPRDQLQRQATHPYSECSRIAASCAVHPHGSACAPCHPASVPGWVGRDVRLIAEHAASLRPAQRLTACLLAHKSFCASPSAESPRRRSRRRSSRTRSSSILHVALRLRTANRFPAVAILRRSTTP